MIKKRSGFLSDNIIRRFETNNCIYFVYPLSRMEHAQISISRMDQFWYVNRVIVPKGFRGKGIGSALMSYLIGWADSNQITLVLEVNSYGQLDNFQLEEWYTQYGFVTFFIEEPMPALIRKPNEVK